MADSRQTQASTTTTHTNTHSAMVIFSHLTTITSGLLLVTTTHRHNHLQPVLFEMDGFLYNQCALLIVALAFFMISHAIFTIIKTEDLSQRDDDQVDDDDNGGDGTRIMRKIAVLDYICLVMILIPFIISLVGYWKVTEKVLREDYTQRLKSASNSASFEFLNAMHFQLKCCGAWNVSEWVNGGSGIPFSCCNRTVLPPCVLQGLHLQERHAFRIPCVERFLALRRSNSLFCNFIIFLCVVFLLMHRFLCNKYMHARVQESRDKWS